MVATASLPGFLSVAIAKFLELELELELGSRSWKKNSFLVEVETSPKHD